MNKEFTFEEKQYVGHNVYSLMRRIVLAVFCFFIYFFSEKRPGAIDERYGEIAFYMGIAILIISVLLLFVLHLKTTVSNGSIVLDGLWTSKRVKIDLSSIESVNIETAKIYLSNRSVYNLHFKGTIKFYTYGRYTVELIDKDGLIYRIGSQRPIELKRAIEEEMGLTAT